MGKWSSLADAKNDDGTAKYAPMPIDAGYGAKLMARVDELKTLTFPELTAAFDAAFVKKQEIEAALKAAEFEKEAHARAVDAAMKALGIDQCRVNGYTLSPSIEPYPVVEDKMTLIEHMIATQPANLLVHAGTLTALVKSALTGDGDMPPGVGIFLKTKFSRTKSGKSK